jgi:hypothetical protein
LLLFYKIKIIYYDYNYFIDSKDIDFEEKLDINKLKENLALDKDIENKLNKLMKKNKK